jgi:FtsZ-interacting cell division protein ZipA
MELSEFMIWKGVIFLVAIFFYGLWRGFRGY